MSGLLTYRDFLRAHPAEAAFGFGTLFFSCFGQTFFISLFVPAILADLSLEAGAFGPIYAAATIGCGLLMPALGARYDTTPLSHYATWSFAGMAVACALMAATVNIAGLFLALLALRLCGQGLFSHISITTMARTPRGYRGVALAVGSLGYVGAELTLPGAVSHLPAEISWRWVWVGFAVLCAAGLIPTMRGLLKRFPESRTVDPGERAGAVLAGCRLMMTDRRFLLLLPATLASPVIMTALMLYQLPLAAAKGWSYDWMAGCFTLFAATKVAASLAAGPWLDRVGPVRFIAASVPLLALALAALAFGRAPTWGAAGYMLAGLALGTGGALTAVWSDLYGRENLGTVRGFTSALTIFASAVGPGLAGLCLQAGVSFERLLLLSAAVMAVCAIPVYHATKVIRHHPTTAG